MISVHCGARWLKLSCDSLTHARTTARFHGMQFELFNKLFIMYICSPGALVLPTTTSPVGKKTNELWVESIFLSQSSHSNKSFLHRFTCSNSSILHAVHYVRNLFNLSRNGSRAPSAHSFTRVHSLPFLRSSDSLSMCMSVQMYIHNVRNDARAYT